MTTSPSKASIEFRDGRIHVTLPPEKPEPFRTEPFYNADAHRENLAAGLPCDALCGFCIWPRHGKACHDDREKEKENQ